MRAVGTRVDEGHEVSEQPLRRRAPHPVPVERLVVSGTLMDVIERSWGAPLQSSRTRASIVVPIAAAIRDSALADPGFRPRSISDR